MTGSEWKCTCGNYNVASATVCVLCKTSRDSERIVDDRPEGSISRIIGFMAGLSVLALTVWIGLTVGGGSLFAGIFVIILVLSLGLIAKYYFGNEPSVRRVLHWLFPFKWI